MLLAMRPAPIRPTSFARSRGNCSIFPDMDVLLVFDRVVSTDPAFRKTWLLHGVNMPWVEGTGTAVQQWRGDLRQCEASSVCRKARARFWFTRCFPRTTSQRGAADQDMNSGRRAMPTVGPGEAAATGRSSLRRVALCQMIPSSSQCGGSSTTTIFRASSAPIAAMWFPDRGGSKCRLSQPQLEDHFLHVFEIGDRGKTGRLSVELLQGAGDRGRGCAIAG